ncbi:hypothetical protein RQM59_05170 [Flavobacteriaceae bacterium S356]|uniref:3-keto-disaccharide hydrolase domain-containing protein n=1 Tax=Asprobacillus argus TaxID=3076534 RepID=A0ABU3LEY1_9FLAO|nr:hypothetical protein [Flavobacteriaceae bacterium S356]
MKSKILLTISLILTGLASFVGNSQNTIPLDTINWQINARSYVFENYKGKDAIYIQAGAMRLKNKTFLNGTIEFDIYLKETQAFPGLYFRVRDNKDGEQWFLRPHLSGKPDANQAAPAVNGITPWQLYFGPRYSFPYDYTYDDWTHVKVVVNGNKAQVFLNHSETPNLSWNLFHETKPGEVIIRGGGLKAMHIANVKIDENAKTLMNFKPIERKAIPGLVSKWEVSDMFEEKLLADPHKVASVIRNRKWGRKIVVEEGTAANISRVQLLRNGKPGNTVFAKVVVHSDKRQTKLFQFGYSDRVVAILNGTPIYKGSNRWRSRDYRYLGTVGLFDGIYLNLKKGKNTLLMAVSEDFGGWLITGKFANKEGVRIIEN